MAKSYKAFHPIVAKRIGAVTDRHNIAPTAGSGPTAVPTFPKWKPPVRLAAYQAVPRRIFRHLKMQQSKFVQDVLVLKIALTEADYPELGRD